MTGSSPTIPADNIIGLVAHLPHMETDELKALWAAHFDDTPISYRRSYMVPRLAFRIQEVTYGGLTEQALETL